MKVSQFAPVALLIWAVALLGYLYGAESVLHKWFPYPTISASTALMRKMVRDARGHVGFPYLSTRETRTVIVRKPGAIAPGLTLISGVGPKGALFAKLIDADGKVQHVWDLDWFRLWPDAKHLPPDAVPKERPGTVVHGMLLSANGDLTFNYDTLGLMQVDFCGRPKWRLPKRTSHSLFRDEAGNFWTFDYNLRTKSDPATPNLGPPYRTYNILEVSPAGRLLRTISVDDVLTRNGYKGMLYMNPGNEDSTKVKGDTLHLNSVEIFPSRFKSDYFKAGDIMVSIRNISSIIVVDPETLAIKAIAAGRFLKQHDPHFIDGSTISVFDNNDTGAKGDQASTRIVTYSFKDGKQHLLFEGAPGHPFFTYRMGKQYLLANGDLLLTEAEGDRVIEVGPQGNVLWEYFNQVKPGVLGLLTDAQRIAPGAMSPANIATLAASCPKS